MHICGLFIVSLLILLGGCAEPASVPISDIVISKGPDGEIVYTPRIDSTPTSALAQYLQLQADFAGISKSGYFLDTQLANLHQQVNLLRRAEYFKWRWQGLDGKNIDIATALADARKKIKTLDVNG